MNLELVQVGTGFTLKAHPGVPLSLGRNSLKLQDVRVSREQLVVEFDGEHASVKLTGANPSFIKCQGKDDFVKMEKEQSYKLFDKSVIKVLHSGPLLEVVLKKHFSDLILAFPSLSTGAFQFDEEKAMVILVEQVERFLKGPAKTLDHVKLVLVDIASSSVLERAKKLWANRDSRFSVMVADVTRIFSHSKVPACVIVNSANSKLSPKGSGINRAVYEACPDLDVLTREKATYLLVGQPLVVELPENCSFRRRENVNAVMHVVGPNMNPNRPDCISDYAVSGPLLADCYRNVFVSFLKYAVPDVGVFDASDNNNNNNNNNNSNNNNNNVNVNPINNNISGKEVKNIGGWSGELIKYCVSPEKFDSVVLYDADFVVVKDLYPKARFHFLILPRNVRVELSELTRSHLQLVRDMVGIGSKVIGKLGIKAKTRIGFHSVPSMKQLHAHLISQDFDSECLKNKKHWNSFTTSFFVDASDVISNLEREGIMAINKTTANALLSQDLRCHVCKIKLSNMPKLKAHIETHDY